MTSTVRRLVELSVDFTDANSLIDGHSLKPDAGQIEDGPPAFTAFERAFAVRIKQFITE